MPTDHFLLGGAQRSGTTLLYHLLDQHPEIEMARPLRPEPKFFLRPDAVSADYASLFRGKAGAHVFGEKSTSYMERADVAPVVLSVLRDPKIVFLLRDPVERAISNYRFSVENGVESASLEEAIFNEGDRRDHYDHSRFSVSPFAYTARGHYHRFIEQWESAIGRERIHLVVLERLMMQDLFRWLGVNPSFEVQIPSDRLNESTIDTDVSAEVRRYLAGQFQESNRILHERYGVDVSLWMSR